MKIDEEGNLYDEVVRRCEYACIGNANLDESTLREISEAVANNGGRPVSAGRFLPRNFLKNSYPGY